MTPSTWHEIVILNIPINHLKIKFMAIRKDGSQLGQDDERNTGLSRQGDQSGSNRTNDDDELETRNVASNAEETEEDYDDAELAEDDFEVDEEEDAEEDVDDEDAK